MENKTVTRFPFGYCDQCNMEAALTPSTCNYPAIDHLVCALCFHDNNCYHRSRWDGRRIHAERGRQRRDWAKAHPLMARIHG